MALINVTKFYSTVHHLYLSMIETSANEIGDFITHGCYRIGDTFPIYHNFIPAVCFCDIRTYFSNGITLPLYEQYRFPCLLKIIYPYFSLEHSRCISVKSYLKCGKRWEFQMRMNRLHWVWFRFRAHSWEDDTW